MKSIASLITGAAITSLLAMPVGVALGQVDTVEMSDEPNTTQVDHRLSDRADSIEERKTQRRAEVDARIDEARTDHVAGRCENAQALILAAINRAAGIEMSRDAKYAAVTSKLVSIVERLDAAEIDTTELASQVAIFEQMVADFGVNFDNYQLALNDASAIDCVNDTEGFILALEDAKSLRDQLKADAIAIKSYLRTTIISTLNAIKDSLSTDSAESDES